MLGTWSEGGVSASQLQILSGPSAAAWIWLLLNMNTTIWHCMRAGLKVPSADPPIPDDSTGESLISFRFMSTSPWQADQICV